MQWALHTRFSQLPLKFWLYLVKKAFVILLFMEQHRSQFSQIFQVFYTFNLTLFFTSFCYYTTSLYRLLCPNSPWTSSICIICQSSASLPTFLLIFQVLHLTNCSPSPEVIPPPLLILNAPSAYFLLWMETVRLSMTKLCWQPIPRFPPPPHHSLSLLPHQPHGQGMFVELLVTYWLDSCCKSLLFNYKE